MDMHIELNMVRSDDLLSVERDGEAIVINGQRLDLSTMSEGDVLPLRAIDCRWIGGPITKVGGALRLTLLCPHGPVAPGEVISGDTIVADADGPVALPCLQPDQLGSGDITVDWSQLITEASRRAELRNAALSVVEEEHAAFLRQLTGGATIEERDTWNVKEAAARALLDDSATDSQTQMLTLEADGRQEPVANLAALVVAKADQFRTLVGLTAKLRAVARQAVVDATDDSVLISDVPEALAAAEAQRAAARQAALSEI